MFQKPAKINRGKHYDTCMTYLGQALRDHESAGGELLTVTEKRYACGLPLPPFQRPKKWTQERQIKFIESAWRDVPLDSFIIHRMDWESSGSPTPFSGWVVDGQQRLTAIEGYWKDEFPVFGARWSQLSKQDQREFMLIKFPHYEIVASSEDEIKEMYLLMAFGGVAHTEEDRQHALKS